MSDKISLPDLPRALIGMGVSAPYLTLWRLVIAGDLPAHRHGRRWQVDASDLPRIAKTLASR